MKFTRRSFLCTTAAAVALTSAQSRFVFGQEKTKLLKAQIIGFPDEKNCEKLKDAGYDGAELTKWNATAEEAQNGRKLAEKYGLKLHSVMRGWTNINDAANFDADVESVKTALKAAAAYGADTVLWVPCKVGGFPNSQKGKPDQGLVMPAAWEFDIDYDPETLKVNKVVSGDNSAYTDYIAAQNTATEAVKKALAQLLPVAEELKVNLGIENVWNNLWSEPNYYAALCKYAHSQSPRGGAYFDLGNHTMYAAPQEWLKALGSGVIFKLHIKGFKVPEPKGKLGGGPGSWCKIDESAIDWKVVRKTLTDIGYNGWVSVEEGGYDYAKYKKILDEFDAGTL
ncbi:MAG: sugar phosphate isomerase/epimerase [Planctomycetaceae bacterium]|jgi:hexulose-6-phosphate isomerase|nr:sugar phosphate isomerase/epimerase [Planctomycetaceae bacterium]